MAIDRHGPHRWELRLQSGALEAVQLNRLVEVAQSEATDRRELDVGDVPRLGGDDLGGEHLTTVRRVGHPSRLVNRQGDVVAIAGRRDTSVDPHPNSRPAVGRPARRGETTLGVGAGPRVPTTGRRRRRGTSRRVR